MKSKISSILSVLKFVFFCLLYFRFGLGLRSWFKVFGFVRFGLGVRSGFKVFGFLVF